MQTTTSNDKLNSALGYIKLDLPVHPLRGKRPLVKGWPKLGVPDESTVRDWWRKYPDANLGVVCGKASGFFVFDVDAKYGGLQNLEALEDEYGPLPETLIAQTGGGGRHFFFKFPPGGLGNATGELPSGLDIRGEGGQVAVSPSIHPDTGKEYAWQDYEPGEIEIAEAPTWLLGLIKGKASSSGNGTGKRLDPQDFTEIPEGERNNTLFRLGCSLRAKGASEEGITNILRLHNEQRCKPQLNPEDIQTIIGSVLKYPPGNSNGQGSAVYIPTGTSGEGELTDLGNSLRFIKLYGDKILYVPSWGKFFIWNGWYWEEDKSGQIYKFAIQASLSIYAEAAEHTDPKMQKALVKFAKTSQSKPRLEAAIHLSKHQVAVSSDLLDADQYLFNVQNGTIDLKSGKLLAHNPAHLITKISPVEYDPEATCPTWDRFLLEIMNGDQEMVDFLQRVVGYALTGSTSEQCLFLLYGVGRNGKSVFLEVLMSLFGDHGRKAEMKSFLEKKGDGGTNDLAALAGARFVCASEIGRSKAFNESLIKEITGQDQITARFLYQEFFSFTPRFKIFLAANAKPQVRGVDEGIWRRMRLIPFDVVIPKEKVDKHLAEKLRSELPGILRWTVEGCLIWQQKGLEEPKNVTNATQGYRRESDHLADFFETICDLAETQGLPKDKLTVPAGILFLAYESYCEGSGVSCVSKRTFGVMMGERGFTAKVKYQRGQNLRVYSGLCLKEDRPVEVL